MDCFFNAVPLKRKARGLHFHEFMREVHHRELEGPGARQNSAECAGCTNRQACYKLICFR